MRCQKCGAELPAGAQFCKHCGTRAEAVPTEAYASLARETAAAAEALRENSLRLAEAYRDGMAARTEELRGVREQSARESAALREQLKAALLQVETLTRYGTQAKEENAQLTAQVNRLRAALLAAKAENACLSECLSAAQPEGTPEKTTAACEDCEPAADLAAEPAETSKPTGTSESAAEPAAQSTAEPSAAPKETVTAAPSEPETASSPALLCPGCGAPVEPGSVFCGECGARL